MSFNKDHNAGSRAWSVVLGSTALVSLPASIGPLSELIRGWGWNPALVGTILAGGIAAAAAEMFRRVVADRKSIAIESHEHDLVHSFRDHATEVSVLAQKDSLSRDQFDNSLDHALQGAADRLAAIATVRIGKPCSATIHLIDENMRFPFVSRDRASYKARSMVRRKEQGLSTGMKDILESDYRDAPFKVYSKISKDYEDTDVEAPRSLYNSVIITGIQCRVEDIIRERHRPKFGSEQRLMAGFLTIESTGKVNEDAVFYETFAKYADLLFLGLEHFALAEVKQFGLENSTIGHVATGLYRVEGEIIKGLNFGAKKSDAKDESTNDPSISESVTKTKKD